MHFKVQTVFKEPVESKSHKNNELRIQQEVDAILQNAVLGNPEEPQNLPEENGQVESAKAEGKAEAAKKRKQNQKRKTTERARKKSRNKRQIYQKTEEISREKEDSVPDFPEETDLAACVARTIRMCFTDVTLKVNLWRSSRSRERWVK